PRRAARRPAAGVRRVRDRGLALPVVQLPRPPRAGLSGLRQAHGPRRRRRRGGRRGGAGQQVPGADGAGERRSRRSRAHRRAAPLLSADAVLTAGVDIGGTKLLAVAATGKGEIVAERRQATPAGADAVLSAMALVVADLLAAAPRIAAVGVGLPGLVDLDGAIHYAPNLPGFVGVPARERLAARLPVPVAVDNDANVAALGEVLHGAGRGRREVLVVTLGTGIGGGLVINGTVNRGGFGLAAEIGHFTVDRAGPVCACGERGHWEALAWGTALGRRAREWAARGDAPGVLARAGGVVEAITGHEAGESALAGEADGRAILTEH